jgi:hypothetical protein
MKWHRLLAALPLLVVALVIIAWPSDAQAWGPLAHLNFSAQALASLGTVQPGLRQVLTDFGDEFLYGSLAADIVVGKNMARYLYHCHNWRVGFNVFKHAKPGGEQAFALGFLSHLAADTVAHNYFVPYKTVASYHKVNTRHAYWELRYDQKMDKALSKLAKQVTTRSMRNHDDYLERMLYGSSVLPFRVSKQLFRSLLATARIGRFGQVSSLTFARERKLPLEPDLVTDTNDLAFRAIVGMLNEGERSEAARADATGARNIRLASDLRKSLKQKTAHRIIAPRDAHEIAAETREAFRKAINGKLILPPSIARLAA